LTVDDLIGDVTQELHKVVERKEDLDGDDLDTIERVVADVLKSAEEAIDEAADEEDDETEQAKP
jgi:hypothetical protein